MSATLETRTDGPPGRTDEPRDCCAGSRAGGDLSCACWEPIFDALQEEGQQGPQAVRQGCCNNCAFRPDSPEATRTDEYAGARDSLIENARTGGEPFICHKGVRTIVGWRHPDGREMPADPGHFAPPPMNGLHVVKADGSPADFCGGWAGYHPAAIAGVERPA